MPRSLLVLSICGLAATSAVAGLSAQKSSQPPSAGSRTERLLENPEPVKKADPGSALEKQKVFLNRLLTELQRSPRSFVYLRSIGFTESDEEFEKLISANDAIFQRVRIIRRDEQGNRQIPGWPGISLREEFKTARR